MISRIRCSEVRLADCVVVDQIERAHSRAGKRLDRVAAYAADAEHRYTAFTEAFDRVLAEKERRPHELSFHFSVLHKAVEPLKIGDSKAALPFLLDQSLADQPADIAADGLGTQTDAARYIVESQGDAGLS